MWFDVCGIAEVDPSHESKIVMNLGQARFSHVAILHRKKVVYHIDENRLSKSSLGRYTRNKIIIERVPIMIDVSEDFALGVLEGMLSGEYFAPGLVFLQKCTPLRHAELEKQFDFMWPRQTIERAKTIEREDV